MPSKDRPAAAIRVVHIAALIVQHEPSSDELMALVDISYAQLKRYISALRTIGCVIRYVRMRDGSQYMTMDDTGVFDRQKLLETGPRWPPGSRWRATPETRANAPRTA